MATPTLYVLPQHKIFQHLRCILLEAASRQDGTTRLSELKIFQYNKKVKKKAKIR